MVTIKFNLFGDMSTEELIKFFEDEASKITCVLKEVEIDICDVQLVEDDGKRT